jgi:nucleoside-diphosphate-sugar epimerase
MRALVVGATGGTGRAVVDALLARGHEVTAMARHIEPRPQVRVVRGDARVAHDVERAVAGQDVVIVTLGIAENALAVRVGLGKTPMDVRSAGTRNVIDAMRKYGVRRLVVQSSYGVGPSRDRLTLAWKLIFALVLRPQIDDTEQQEALVRTSGLDWTLVQPVGLVDPADDREVFASLDGEVRRMRVARSQVAAVMVDAAARSGAGETVAVSS